MGILVTCFLVYFLSFLLLFPLQEKYYQLLGEKIYKLKELLKEKKQNRKESQVYGKRNLMAYAQNVEGDMYSVANNRVSFIVLLILFIQVMQNWIYF